MVCALAIAQALVAAWTSSWTTDEPAHLFWSARLLLSGTGERESYPTLVSKTPVVLPNVLVLLCARTFDPQVVRLLARVPSVAWYAALLATVYWLTRSFVAPSAAPLAMIACALDPNLVAHGSLATADGVFALTTTLTLGTGLALASCPSAARAAALGIALGLAIVAKFSGLLLIPSILLLPALFPRRFFARGRALLLDAALLVASACTVICAGYLFSRVALPLAAAHWQSPLLERLSAWAPRLRLPLPMDLLTGIDSTLAWERQAWNSVVLGRVHPHGVWYYFVVLWLLKTPVVLLLVTAAGLGLGVRSGELLRNRAAFYLAVNLAFFLAYFSLIFHSQIGYRFVLMCIPLAYVLAGASLVPLSGRPWVATAGLGVVLVSVVENLLYLGNPLAFTNAAVWPKSQVFRLIADSNIDWGQNDDRYQVWLRDAGAQIHFEPAHILPGTNAFRLNTVAGVQDFARHRWLRENLDPVRHLGHTLLLFEVAEAQFDRFLAEERLLQPSPAAAGLCNPLPVPKRVVEPRDSGGIAVSLPKGVAIACLDAPEGADVGIEGLRGAAVVSPCAESARADALPSGWVCWYRLEPGRHALCLQTWPGAVSPFEGRWLARRSNVAVRVRPASTAEQDALALRVAQARGRVD